MSENLFWKEMPVKLKTEAYPYPVLSPASRDNNDYEESAFQCLVNDSIDGDNLDEQKIIFSYDFLLSNEELYELIEEKKASFALSITCKATGFKEIFTFENKKGTFSLPIQDFYDAIEVYPIIIAVTEIDDFTSQDLHSEYLISNEDEEDVFRTFKIKSGDLLAFDDPTTTWVGFEKQRIQSLLRVVLDETQEPYTYSIDTDYADVLKVKMSKEIKEMWGNSSQKEYLFMPVIKDCVLAALDAFRTDEITREKKWAQLFLEAAQKEDIDEETTVDELNVIAQKVSKKISLNYIRSKGNHNENS